MKSSFPPPPRVIYKAFCSMEHGFHSLVFSPEHRSEFMIEINGKVELEMPIFK